MNLPLPRPPAPLSPGAPLPPPAVSAPLPPPAGLVVGGAPSLPPSPMFDAPKPSHQTLPLRAGFEIVAVLTISLIVGKLVIDALVQYSWPIAAYVALLSLIGYGPSLWWARRVSKRDATGDMWGDLGARPKGIDFAWGPVVWLAAIGCQLVAGIIVTVAGVPTTSNTEGLSELADDRTYVIALVVTAVIAAPIVEELVFRGVLLRSLLSKFTVVPAIGLQAVLFGVAHADPVRGAGNIGLVLVLSAVGAALGAAAYMLRRIVASMVAHAILNGVVLTLVLSGVADRLQEQVG